QINGECLMLGVIMQMAERVERLLEEPYCVAAPARPEPCLARVPHRLLPHLGVYGVMRQRFDPVATQGATRSLERLAHLAVPEALAIVQETPVRHVVRQRMAKRVDWLGKERLLLEELSVAEPRERRERFVSRQIGNDFQERAWHVLPDDRRAL